MDELKAYFSSLTFEELMSLPLGMTAEETAVLHEAIAERNERMYQDAKRRGLFRAEVKG